MGTFRPSRESELGFSSQLATLTYQTLLACRVPINSILGFIIRTYRKVGFGGLRHVLCALHICVSVCAQLPCASNHPSVRTG